MDDEEADTTIVFTTETKVTNGKEDDVQEWRISLLQ